MSIRTVPEAVQAASTLLGSQRALARALGLAQQTVRGWVVGAAPVPAKQAAHIERLTAGAVPAYETCPSVPWHLVHAKQAPPHLQAALALCRDHAKDVRAASSGGQLEALCDAYEAGLSAKTPRFLREFVRQIEREADPDYVEFARLMRNLGDEP